MVQKLAGGSGNTTTGSSYGEGLEFKKIFPFKSLTPENMEFLTTLARRGFTNPDLQQHCTDARNVLQMYTTPIQNSMKRTSIIHFFARDFPGSFEFKDVFEVTMVVYFNPPKKTPS
jgi:hypothetical protein